MKKLIGVAAALVILANACEIDTGGGGRDSGFGGFGANNGRSAGFERRVEARRDRLQERRRLAAIERRRQARLAALRRERRAEQRRERQAALAAPAPEPESCTEGYDPCLAPASDYDCEGGSGDGPAYTGYVTVTGYDPYDLDADGDGVGCES
ncbi:MAG TPA: hypothetical protein VHN37_13210 [Actinomycetota bacterium]|nr:hypothetical protein [Actinomycetota bacterium]